MVKLNKLITYAYLKEECDLPQTLPDDELEHKIYRAQEMLRMLMGDAFYQAYLTEFLAGTPSGTFATTAYGTIFPYIKQFIAWQAHEYWVPKANFKVTRGGFRVHSETNSVVASDIQMAAIIKDAKYQSQYYKTLFVDYLNNHYADYPLYEYGCKDDKRGNGFHISAVKNKRKRIDPYHIKGGCCHD